VPSSAANPVDAGFSLIEALVALVIAGLALTAIAGVFGTGFLVHQASDEVATALTLAEGKIAAAEAGEALRPGRSEGIFAGRYSWELMIALYDDRKDADRQDARTQGNAGTVGAQPLSALRLYRIAAAVAWHEGARQRRLALATLRLGPPPP
jgi:prepilin-type N-terminal cleavage/methylation domain-containing protein